MSSPFSNTLYNYWSANPSGGSQTIGGKPAAGLWIWRGESAIGSLEGRVFTYIISTRSAPCNGSAIFGPPTNTYIDINPNTVWEGQRVYVSWGASGVVSHCTVNGEEVSKSASNIPVTVVPELEGIYTIYCSNYYGSGPPASDRLTVRDCPSSITISPPHNPNPSDALWITNYSFLTNRSVSAIANESVSWTITPRSPGGAVAQPNSGAGRSFAFNLSFIVPPGGSRAASTALSAQINAVHQPCELSTTNTITQDTRDIIRQEYVNHRISNVPARSSFNRPTPTANFTVAEINVTAYPLILGQPGFLARRVRDEWNSLIGQELGQPPTDHGLYLTSSWRNPERNEFFKGSTGSRHLRGNAVDLVISNKDLPVLTGITRSRLWCLLEEAGDNVASGVPEKDDVQVLCTDSMISHVHVE